MRWLLDKLILATVEIWIIIVARRQVLRLYRRQYTHGLWRVRIAAPRLADEKFLWRKIFDLDPRFVTVTDKAACKLWIKEQGIAATPPETLWVGTDAEDIPDEIWTRPVYVKASHGWRMNIPVLTPPDDPSKIILEANSFMKREHGRRHREWAYQHVPRRLLVEEAVFHDQNMIEMKCYTYGTVVEQIVLTRHGHPTTSGRWLRQSDGSYALQQIPTTHSPIIDTLPWPPCAEEGLKIASEIGALFDHMRVDLMCDENTVRLGELTVYNQSGRAHRQGHYAGAPLNRSWDLRESWFLRTKQKGWRAVYATALRRTIDRREREGRNLA